MATRLSPTAVQGNDWSQTQGFRAHVGGRARQEKLTGISVVSTQTTTNKVTRASAKETFSLVLSKKGRSCQCYITADNYAPDQHKNH